MGISPRILKELWTLIKVCRGTRSQAILSREEQNRITKQAWVLIHAIRGERSDPRKRDTARKPRRNFLNRRRDKRNS